MTSGLPQPVQERGLALISTRGPDPIMRTRGGPPASRPSPAATDREDGARIRPRRKRIYLGLPDNPRAL